MTYATFRGGIHPPGKKELSAHKAIVPAGPTKRVVIPFSQHLGAPSTPLVSINETVKKGQKIGEPGGFVSAPVHASVSGKVVAIGEFPNVMGRMTLAAVIENDMQMDGLFVRRREEIFQFAHLRPQLVRHQIVCISRFVHDVPRHCHFGSPPLTVVCSFSVLVSRL